MRFQSISPRLEVGEFRPRYKWMVLGAALGFSLLFVRVVQVQVFQHRHYARISEDNITKTLVLPATRGLILDRDGRVIANNRPSYDVLLTPSLLRPDTDIARIGELMNLDSKERIAFRKRLEKIPRRRYNQQVRAFVDITRDQLAALETHAEDLPGLDVIATPVRRYAYDGLSAHAIGYLNEVSAEDIEKNKGKDYRAGDQIGRTGIEGAWESTLRGVRGFHRVTVDARGRLQDPALRRQLRSRTMHQDPVPGHNVQLSLDMELMRAVQRAFRGHPSGAAVVVETRTGRVRALYSKPAYNLNEMSGRLSVARFTELTEDPFRPLIDKTVYESYFPGSTFKPISALAALGDHVMDSSSRVECIGHYELGNRRFRCTKVHRDVDMRQALTRSCNVFFYRLAEQVGLDRLTRYAREFGLGARTGLGVNSEAKGFVPTKSWYKKHYKTRFRLGFTLNAAIGQGNTRVTLMQMAMAYAAMANHGTLYVPQLVERVTDESGRIVKKFKPKVRRMVDVPQEHIAHVLEGLDGVVNDKKGTAHEAYDPQGVRVAGKTGTAQVSKRAPREGEDPNRSWYFNRDHAWFAGFAPADAPEIVAIVLVEHGGAGGKTAAPIAVQIFQDYFSDERAIVLGGNPISRDGEGG